jgi:hypothetical protein
MDKSLTLTLSFIVTVIIAACATAFGLPPQTTVTEITGNPLAFYG